MFSSFSRCCFSWYFQIILVVVPCFSKQVRLQSRDLLTTMLQHKASADGVIVSVAAAGQGVPDWLTRVLVPYCSAPELNSALVDQLPQPSPFQHY